MDRSQASSVDDDQAARRYAWYVVALLTLVQITSYVDRFLPSLLIDPIKHDLALTDFQIGLLIGPAFGVFYVLMGVPLGWLADRLNRRSMLAGGIAVWSLMTAAGSLATSFAALFGARLGVGLGEATVAPCAISMISDYFPRARRSRAMSLFMSGTFLGAGLAFLVGGPFVHMMSAWPDTVVPGIGKLRPWQLTFLIMGLPGLVLALLMFTIREPRRLERTTAGVAGTLREAGGYVALRWRAFGTLFLASACTVTLGSLSFWNITLFSRNFGWNVREVGIATGALFLAGGLTGTLLGIRLTNRAVAARRPDATLRALWFGLLIAVPGFALYPAMPSAQLALVPMFFGFVGQAMAAAAGPASISLIAPGQIRSQAIAIYYLVISVSGQLLGPPPVGAMTDLFGDPAKLHIAMTIEALVIGLPGLILVRLGMPAFARQVTKLESEIATHQKLAAPHG